MYTKGLPLEKSKTIRFRMLPSVIAIGVAFMPGCSQCGSAQDTRGARVDPLKQAEEIYDQLETGLSRNGHDPVLASGFIQAWIAKHAEQLSKIYKEIKLDEGSTKRVIGLSIRGRKAVKIPKFETDADFKKASLAFLKLNSHLISQYLKRLKAHKADLETKSQNGQNG